MEKISYKLPAFEGSLDLLLYLISKNKLSICEIEIAELLNQYMEHISAMEEQNMDIASEFLEMAARLVYIKTVYLLPKHDEAVKLQRELTGQLLEYQECKRIAQLMAENLNFNSFVREPDEIEPDQTYHHTHTPVELLVAYQSAVGHGMRFVPPSPEVFSSIVTNKIVSVASQIIYVLRRLLKTEAVEYENLFEKCKGKSELVATFLAILELVKDKRVRVEGSSCSTRVRLIDGGVKCWKSKI